MTWRIKGQISEIINVLFLLFLIYYFTNIAFGIYNY